MQYHKELFFNVYEDSSKGHKNEKCLRFQIEWHKRCSIFLLTPDACTSLVHMDYTDANSDMQRYVYGMIFVTISRIHHLPTRPL